MCPALSLPEQIADLAGALGDLVWAVHIIEEPSDVLAVVLAMSDDDELVRHRLLLSGYVPESSSLWRCMSGPRIEVIPATRDWGQAAIVAACRNRDSTGVPHVTEAYVANVLQAARQTRSVDGQTGRPPRKLWGLEGPADNGSRKRLY